MFWDCLLYSCICLPFCLSFVVSSAVPFHSLAFLKMLAHFLALQRKCINTGCPLLIMVTLHIPICGMHKLLYMHNTIFLWTCLTQWHSCVKKVFCTFWLGLSCHHSQCLFYIHMFQFLTAFVFNFAIVRDIMLWKLEITDLTPSQFSAAMSSSSVSWCVSWTTLHFSL